MASLGRCPGCGYERPVAQVLSHHRACDAFAELYRTDPDAALVDPVAVYAAAHPVVAPTPKPAAVPKAERAPKQRRTPRPAAVPAEPPARPQGAVNVEYWDWQLTMLEELQAST